MKNKKAPNCIRKELRGFRKGLRGFRKWLRGFRKERHIINYVRASVRTLKTLNTMDYDIIQKPPRGRRENSEYYITPVYRGTIDEEQMADIIVKSTTLTRADVRACISALTEQMADALAAGNKVKIGGLGTFRLQITTPTKELQPTDKVAKLIAVRDVEFCPENDFKRRFSDVDFTRTDHSRTFRRAADSASLLESLRTHFETNEFVRSGQVQALAHCGRAKACRFLRDFVEAGYLVNVGSHVTPLYRATEMLTT